jgi:hypothetical protein
VAECAVRSGRVEAAIATRPAQARSSSKHGGKRAMDCPRIVKDFGEILCCARCPRCLCSRGPE